MVREKEVTCEMALESVLAKEFPVSDYAVGDYKEDAICLQKEQGKWGVYNGFRNTNDNLVLHRNIVDACIDMMKRLSAGNSLLLQNLEDTFFGLIVTDRIA